MKLTNSFQVGADFFYSLLDMLLLLTKIYNVVIDWICFELPPSLSLISWLA